MCGAPSLLGQRDRLWLPELRVAGSGWWGYWATHGAQTVDIQVARMCKKQVDFALDTETTITSRLYRERKIQQEGWEKERKKAVGKKVRNQLLPCQCIWKQFPLVFNFSSTLSAFNLPKGVPQFLCSVISQNVLGSMMYKNNFCMDHRPPTQTLWNDKQPSYSSYLY